MAEENAPILFIAPKKGKLYLFALPARFYTEEVQDFLAEIVPYDFEQMLFGYDSDNMEGTPLEAASRQLVHIGKLTECGETVQQSFSTVVYAPIEE